MFLASSSLCACQKSITFGALSLAVHLGFSHPTVMTVAAENGTLSNHEEELPYYGFAEDFT
jgi:hypothetical protein